MTVRAVDVYEPLGYDNSWFSKRFKHLQLDYMVPSKNKQGMSTVYNIDDLIAECESYTTACKNPIRKAHSEIMMKRTLEHLKGLQ